MLLQWTNKISGQTVANADVNQLWEDIRAVALPFYTAGGSPISKYDIVTSDGLLANTATAAHRLKILGMAFQDTAAAAIGNAQLFGEIDNPGWTWTPHAAVFLNGTVLSQTAPTSGWSMIVGIAILPTRIIIRFTDPYLL